ncbi:MAG TPA: class I SAM-dependent methyltransferase [Planctomycetota bacterium]|nr:class I SAM-dependent methyltransferase [Planctomycetota bacterium]
MSGRSTADLPPREPRSRFYDGRLYAWTFGRLLAGLHERVAREVPDGASVLDACCGAGGLALAVAPRCPRVLGVDLSPRMIAEAERQRAARRLENVTLRVADVAHLGDLADGSFDAATIVLALHEMPAAARVPVLRSLARVARRVIAADFAAPMPWNLAGIRNRCFELSAGPEHFGGYLDYQRAGGLPALIRAAGLRVAKERRLDSGAMVLFTLEAAAS